MSFLKINEQNAYIYSQGNFPNIKTEIRKLVQLKDESIPNFFAVSTKMITDVYKTMICIFIITIQTLLCLPIQYSLQGVPLYIENANSVDLQFPYSQNLIKMKYGDT